MQICEAYGANRYPFPEEPARQRQMNAEVTARLRELHTTIEAGECVCARILAALLTSVSHSDCEHHAVVAGPGPTSSLLIWAANM